MSDSSSVETENTNINRAQYSRPVFHTVLKINSLQAQRVMKRSFSRVAYSLFSMDVVLRIITDQEVVDQLESMIQEFMTETSLELDRAAEHLEALKKCHGIEAMPSYSNPIEYPIEITSPQVAQFAHLVSKLDNLVGIIDTLWLNMVLTSKQRKDEVYQWQQCLNKLASSIISEVALVRKKTQVSDIENDTMISQGDY